MLKLAGLGLWIVLVTACAALAPIYVEGWTKARDQEPADQGTELIKAEMTSIPMIRDGEVIGYLIIQLAFSADKAMLAEDKLEPAPFLNDAAFRVIFSNTEIDFRRMTGLDLDRLTAEIADKANMLLGMKIVRRVLIEQLNFVKKEDIRTNWIKGEAKKQPAGGGDH